MVGNMMIPKNSGYEVVVDFTKSICRSTRVMTRDLSLLLTVFITLAS